MTNSEEQLEGGRITWVTRVGDTVRRPKRPWSGTVQELLAHLRANGFLGVPEPQGFDDEGREMLSFVEGRAATGVPPAYVWHDNTLREVARLVRSMHDASVAFLSRRDLPWQTIEPRSGDFEVICHNDIAPWNTVFRDERPVAFIDWDWAGPGRRLDDIAYAMWHFVPLYGGRRCVEIGAPSTFSEWRARVNLFCNEYGVAFNEGVMRAVIDRQSSTLRGIQHLADRGVEVYQRLLAEGSADGIIYEREFVARNIDEFVRDNRRPGDP